MLTFKQQRLHENYVKLGYGSEVTPNQVNEALNLQENNNFNLSIGMIDPNEINVAKQDYINDKLRQYPEILDTASKDGFAQLTPEYIQQLSSKAQLSRERKSLPELKDRFGANDFIKNEYRKTYMTSEMNRDLKNANDPRVSEEDRAKYRNNAERTKELISLLPNYEADGYVEKSAEFIGNLAGSGLEVGLENLGITTISTAIGGAFGGPLGAAIGAGAGKLLSSANTFRYFKDPFIGENTERLINENPDLSLEEAYDKSLLTSYFQASTESLSEVIGFGFGGAGQKAAARLGGAKIADVISQVSKGFGAIGDVTKEAAKSITGEIIEEALQNVAGDSLSDAEKNDLTVFAANISNAGDDIINLFDSAPLNERNAALRDMLKYGGLVLGLGGATNAVIENKSDWVKTRQGSAETHAANQVTSIDNLDKIVEENNATELNKTPSMNKDINKNLFT